MNTIGSETMEKVLGRVKRDEHIKGAVVRVDSPGGSALASELIWQSLRDVANQKPVFVSLGDTAASGGYYIASAADRIYAAPTSVVGSIGVVGGKIALGGLYEKIGINVTQRSRGPMAGIFSTSQPFTDQQRTAMRSALQQTYDQFIQRVRVGRGKRIEQIDKVAKGRVFTGAQGVDNGLVDGLGGLEQTTRKLAKQLKMKPGEYATLHLPAPMSLQEFFSANFGSNGQAQLASSLPAAIETARQTLGNRRWQAVAPVLRGFLTLRDQAVLTLMPTALVFE
jgi:protease-4